MELIKLLDVANPKLIKDTLNRVSQDYEAFRVEIEEAANAALNTAVTANDTANAALATVTDYEAIVMESAQDSSSARLVAEEALAMITQADERSQEAALLAEQSFTEASEAVQTSELAMKVANEAKSTVDQALDIGTLGSFVHNIHGIALAHAHMTDDPNQADDEELSFLATPTLVREAIKDKANTNDDTQTITTGKLVVNNGTETYPEPGIYVHGKMPTITLKADEDTDTVLSGQIRAANSGLGIFTPRRLSVWATDGIELQADAPITIIGELAIRNDRLKFFSETNDHIIKGTANISYTSDDNTLQADSNFSVLGGLSVNGNINNAKLDYQLDQSISVTEQSNVFIPVDFNKYDYKLCMWLSVHTDQSSVKNISIFMADNGTIRNSSGRWVYTGVTSNQGNATPSVANYCWQGESNASVFLCDNENNKDRYNRINVELYHSGGQTIDYQSTTSRAYGASFEYKNAGGLIYDEGYNTLPNQLCIFNGGKSSNQLINGNIRVYKRPKF